MPLFRVAVSLRGRCEIDVYAKDARAAEDEIHRMAIFPELLLEVGGKGLFIFDKKNIHLRPCPARRQSSASTPVRASLAEKLSSFGIHGVAHSRRLD